VLFIADEVMSGFGRTGDRLRRALGHPRRTSWWRRRESAVVCAAGVLAAHEQSWARCVQRNAGVMGHTYDAEPVSAAAGLAVLEYLHGTTCACSAQRGTSDGRPPGADRSTPHPGRCAGMGLLLGVELVQDRRHTGTFAVEAGMAFRFGRAS